MAPHGIPSVEAPAFPQGAAYMNGRFIPIADARVSVLDWGFLHSDVTYDTVHVWNGRFFASTGISSGSGARLPGCG